jgi:phosphoenolpyruvate---glycerone phosphotransferase subunit DhaL
MIEAISEAIANNKELLTTLDTAIGDADHGINMERGFTAVRTKLAGLDTGRNDIGGILKTTGMTLLYTVGGASGPLYGTAFLKMALLCEGQSTLDRPTLTAMFTAAVGGIKERGHASRGEKTMLDALEPALGAFTQAINDQQPLAQCLQSACDAASGGVEYTKTIIATKGRASYLGERSLGYQDPGATSSYIILTAITDFCRRSNLEV